MSSIPAGVIQRLNTFLGIPGRPRHILYNGQWIDIGCMEWSPSPSVWETLAHISPELRDALRRSQEFLQREYTNKPAARLAEFFAREPAQVQAEYSAFTSELEQAASPFDKTALRPEVSPALQAATMRIQEQLEGEQFERDGFFDIDRYAVRMQELFQAEPPDIQAEYTAYVTRVQELNAQAARAAEAKEEVFAQVRTLLRDDPVFVYRVGHETIVVAPTTDPFDVLRYERTDGTNYGLQTDDVIEQLKILDAKYGVDILGADSASVEFRLKRIPTGEAAEELGQWLLEFCPDLYEAPTSFPGGKVDLWWN